MISVTFPSVGVVAIWSRHRIVVNYAAVVVAQKDDYYNYGRFCLDSNNWKVLNSISLNCSDWIHLYGCRRSLIPAVTMFNSPRLSYDRLYDYWLESWRSEQGLSELQSGHNAAFTRRDRLPDGPALSSKLRQTYLWRGMDAVKKFMEYCRLTRYILQNKYTPLF